MQRQSQQRGFTIVELLIVIVIIAILATITLITYNGIQVRARDAGRAQDMASIKQALLIYNARNGGVLQTASYGGANVGGWNVSSSPSWLSFLKPSISNVPVDPVNTGTQYPSSSQLAYVYYCYPAGSYGHAVPTVVLVYWSESTSANVVTSFTVDQCL